MHKLDYEIVNNVFLIKCGSEVSEEILRGIHDSLVECLAKMGTELGIALDLEAHEHWDQRLLTKIAPIAAKVKQKYCTFWVINPPLNWTKILKLNGMDSAIMSVASMEEIFGKPNSPAPKLDVKFFNPFVDGAINALKIQCSTEAKPGRLLIKKPGSVYPTEIAAVLGLMSPNFTGSLALCFPNTTFLGIMEKMLGEKYPEITKDLEDGAGELLNIIFGHAKTELNERGFAIEKAIPTIVRGSAIEISHLTPSPTLILQFDSEVGKFHIEMGMKIHSRK